MALKIGITGGIGCGKSTAAEILASLGWEIIDTDVLAHGVYAAGSEGCKKVVDAFGPQVLKGDLSVDRTVLGRIVFSSPDKLRLLNSIVHPLVRAEWQFRLGDHLRRHPFVPVAVIIPLLHEVNAAGEFDRVVCVGCDAETQHARLRGRGLNQAQIEARLKSQLPMEEKIKLSHILIWNSGTRTLLERQLHRLHASSQAALQR